MRYLFIIALIAGTFNAKAQTVVKQDVVDEQVYRYVDEMPAPAYDLNEYFKSNMRYPAQAKKDGVKGRVYVDFVMQANGKAANITVRNSGRYPSLAEEAKRLVEEMPAWNPGKKDGKAVNVAQTATIFFIP